MEDGRPWVDLAHVIQCLNKLDAGVPEKVSARFIFIALKFLIVVC